MSQSFIRRHRAEWQRFNDILSKLEHTGIRTLTPDEIRSFGPLYRKVSADLAFVRSQSFDPELVEYLNDLTGRGYNRLYITESTGQGLIRFVRETLPLTLKRNRRVIWSAIALIYLGVLGGYLMTVFAPHLTQMLFPRAFGEELLKRFRSNEWFNNPFAQRPIVASYILQNNIRVSIYAFASGIIFCLPTLYVLAMNGLLLGHLAAYFSQYGHAYDFWAAVLPHGIIELTAIGFAGAAGWVLGMAWLFPGNLRRADNLSIKGREAAQLFLVSVFLLLIAGMIEGMFSTIPTQSVPNEVRLAVAASSLIFLLYLGIKSRLIQIKPRRLNVK
ncbi:MAG TPA: stage II sporulation protein M [Bacillota bacterium]|nr:stage II sporulation protein M [Bacillota bacterium]